MNKKDLHNREQDAPATTPKLRFPEFRGTGEWVEKSLGDTCRMQAGKFVAASDIKDQNSGDLFPCFGGNGLRGFTATHTHDGVFPLIGRQGALCGNIKLVTGSFHATEHAVVATPNRGVHVIWLYYLLDLLKLNRFATGQAQPGLSVDVLEKVPCSLPKNKPEQQRIADCLSSLDALIVAQARKVDALKTHKKGLMQQLFPRDGETQPRLRFPEFQDAGEWEETTLGEKSSILRGKGISKADLDPHGLQACIRYGELYTRYGETIREVVSRTKVPASELFISKPDDVIIPSSGETKIDIAKASCVLAGGIALGGDLNVIRSNLNGTFLSYYLNGPKRLDIAKVAQGDTVVHLYPHQLEALHIAVPTLPEQQRIADCLSSLDALISAETHKLAVLKTHKQGLMQQLFPSMEEQNTL
jgi:type I restriction enzyme S subunit